MFSTHYAIRPDELAREAENRGFESLWLPEHTHIPVDRKGPTGDPLPEEYWNTFDPFVALTAAAGATRNLRLGTGICLVVQRDPITTAKEVASLDFLSGGRFEFGIGGGWNREEIGNHRSDFKTRWRRLRESVAVMKKIWTEDEPSFEGEFFRFGPMLAYPKPVQKPHPAIHLGGHGSVALDRVVDYCDGWLPIPVRTKDLVADIAELRRRAEAAGRDPKSIAISLFMAPTDEKALHELQALGVDRAIFRLPSESRETILPRLDDYAEVMKAL